MREDMERILLTESDIHARVEELGRQISRDYASREPLFVGVLKGCFIFMADLIRSVDLHCTMDFMAVSSCRGKTFELVALIGAERHVHYHHGTLHTAYH